MKLQYLGTAAAEGWPALFCACEACKKAEALGGKNIRRRSGAIINDKVLIDFNADIFFAKISLKLDLSKVKNIFITHAHEDHCYPEDLGCFFPGYAHMEDHSPLHLWGSQFTKDKFDKRFFGRRPEEMGKLFIFHVIKPYETVEVEGLKFTALPADHGCPESLFYMIEDNGEKWLYAHDTQYFREENWQFLKDHKFDFVSLDCTNGPLDSNAYYGHMGFDTNIPTRERMLEENMADDKTVFVCHHFSHNGHMMHEEMEALMNPKGFLISYDGMVLQGK